MEIDGQVALVTGGASGLGAAAARHLAGLGAQVAVLDRDGAGARAVAAEIGGFDVQADVAVAAEAAAAVTTAMARFGEPARIVVNAAQLAPRSPVLDGAGDVSIDLFRRVVETNLIGTYTVTSYALQALRDAPLLGAERGVVVNVGSIAARDGPAQRSALAATSAAVAALALPLAREAARMAVRVCTIAPGLFYGPEMEGLGDEDRAAIAAAVPFPSRLGAPDEFASLVREIVRNPYLNGTTIRLDGAARLHPDRSTMLPED